MMVNVEISVFSYLCDICINYLGYLNDVKNLFVWFFHVDLVESLRNCPT